MCKMQLEVYKKDLEYLDKIKDKLGLRSKAIALKLILTAIKQHKLEGELR